MIESLKEYNYYIGSFNDQMFLVKENKQRDERKKGNGDILFNITDEDIDSIMSFISTSRFCYNYDKKIDDIIWEELNGFFEGSVSAEQASDFIQNRMSIYLSEVN